MREKSIFTYLIGREINEININWIINNINNLIFTTINFL